MEKNDAITSLITSFRDTALKAGILYIEYMPLDRDTAGVSSVLYEETFAPVDSTTIAEKNPDAFSSSSGENLEISNPQGSNVFIRISPLSDQENSPGFLILQSKSPIKPETPEEIGFLSAALVIINRLTAEPDKPRDDRYRRELINLREMQAQLYPKFEEAKGLDIASAFLPAELMGGNFIDGFFVDSNTYQIVACDIAGYDASSSFAGAAVRTILRSETPKKIMPSQYIEMVINRLKKIKPGLQSMIDLTIYQVDTKTGTAAVSSFGRVNTYFYNHKKKGYVDLAHTDAGKLFAKKNFFKDITLKLESGDGLLFYSLGLVKAPAPGKEDTYGENRLASNFMDEQDSAPVELIHSIVNSVYEFTDYSPQPKDIIMIYAKKE